MKSKSNAMSEINNIVVKDNELIQRTAFNLTALQQKFFCYVVSRIKPDDRDIGRLTISVLDFAEIAGIDRRNAYTEFKKMMGDFRKKEYRWIKVGDTTFTDEIFGFPAYNEKQGSVSVSINPNLIKYLIALRENFTEYYLWNVLSLKSKYSIRLYEIFKSFAFKKNIRIGLDDLKTLLNAENYIYARFKERILDKSIDEINHFTNLIVKYEAVKNGKNHKVTDIDFTIKEKTQTGTYTAYRLTVDRLNIENGQIPGQLSIFDLQKGDYKEM